MSTQATPTGYLSLIRHRPGLLAIAFLAIFSGNLGQSFFIGLFQEPIATQLDISAGEFGSLYATVTLISGFLVLRFGPSVDWTSPRRYALQVLTGLLFGIALLTLSPWWLGAAIGLLLIRLCGQGLFTHLGNTLTGREFTQLRGRALGLVGLGMPAGEMLLPPLVALLLLALAWHQVIWLIATVLVLLWLVLFVTLDWPDSPHKASTRAEKKAIRKRGPNPMRERRFWLLLPMLMALPVTMTGMFIYQAQMTRDLNASITAYALGLAAMGLARLPGSLIGGKWVDQFGVATLARWNLLPFVLMMLLGTLIGGDIGIWLILVGAGITMGMQGPTTDSLLIALWGTEHLGRVRSVRSSFMVFSTAIAPVVLGFLIDFGTGFKPILFGMLLLTCLAWMLALKPIREADPL
ncbi:MFS transporter [Nitrincola sp. MINF-07-Sa-05]|uniref:MFS transporter n=1 Tax=Nitrincola salilacus TaxID=3400273 RepID=UPI003918238E